MGRFLLRRTLNYAVMLFLATTFTYFLAGSYLDPRLNYDRTNPRLDWDSINAKLTAMNINPEQSVFSRYWIWLKGVVLHWDWGYNVGGGSRERRRGRPDLGERAPRHDRLPARRAPRDHPRRLAGDAPVQGERPGGHAVVADHPLRRRRR